VTRAGPRVLFAVHNTRPAGGLEAYLRAVIPLLRDRGADVSVLDFEETDPGPGDAVPAGVPRASGLGLSDEQLVRTAAAFRPSVVYLHGLGDPHREGLLADRFPTAYFLHNYGGMCVSGTKRHAFPAAQVCYRPLGPGCLALYLPRRCGGLNPVTAVGMYRRERRRQRVLRRCAAVLGASRHMVAELVRNGVPADRAHLVPLPVTATPDPGPPAPRPFSGRILFVGRVTGVKGWSHLVDAIPRAAAALGRPLTLVVAGDGPDRETFAAAVRRAGVTAEFLGWVGADRREAEMRAADVLAVPSVWPEPFGLVGVEAGCAGLPAVGYAVGGVPDWLEPGVSGESAPGERPDPRELAAALVRALADPAHWQRLRVGAWETARRFTPQAHLDRLIPILGAAAR
jgi:glycosyltransferase involved in cell wall biosynthesis